MEIIAGISFALLLLQTWRVGQRGGTLLRLRRSVYVADKMFGFIKKIQEMEENDQETEHGPFDLHDIQTELNAASSEGERTIQLEKKNNGRVSW